MTDIKVIAERLKLDLKSHTEHLRRFLMKVEKFDDSILEWNLFLEQAQIELENCQRSSKNLEELSEDIERLQVGKLVFSSKIVRYIDSDRLRRTREKLFVTFLLHQRNGTLLFCKFVLLMDIDALLSIYQKFNWPHFHVEISDNLGTHG